MIQKLKEIIILTASYYNIQLKPEVLAMYAEDLSDLDPVRVIEAYKTYRRDPKHKTFPLPAQIRNLVAPVVDPEAQGREIAGRCVEAIKTFGWAQPEGARAFIGEIGWSVIKSVGGWNYFCEQHGLEIHPGQFYAQARDRIKDQVQYGGREHINAAIERRETESTGLQKPDAAALLERLKNK